MSLGLTNAPATFQRLMNNLFCGNEWNFVFIYLDDILVVSATMEEHIAHVRKVLCRLDEAGLRLKPSKCKFAQQEIEYLSVTRRSETEQSEGSSCSGIPITKVL